MTTFTYIYTGVETVAFNYLPSRKFVNIDIEIQDCMNELHDYEQEFLAFCLMSKDMSYDKTLEKFVDLLEEIKYKHEEICKYNKVKELLSYERVKIYIEDDTYYIKKDGTIVQVDKKTFEEYTLEEFV